MQKLLLRTLLSLAALGLMVATWQSWKRSEGLREFERRALRVEGFALTSRTHKGKTTSFLSYRTIEGKRYQIPISTDKPVWVSARFPRGVTLWRSVDLNTGGSFPWVLYDPKNPAKAQIERRYKGLDPRWGLVGVLLLGFALSTSWGFLICGAIGLWFLPAYYELPKVDPTPALAYEYKRAHTLKAQGTVLFVPAQKAKKKAILSRGGGAVEFSYHSKVPAKKQIEFQTKKGQKVRFDLERDSELKVGSKHAVYYNPGAPRRTAALYPPVKPLPQDASFPYISTGFGCFLCLLALLILASELHESWFHKKARRVLATITKVERSPEFDLEGLSEEASQIKVTLRWEDPQDVRTYTFEGSTWAPDASERFQVGMELAVLFDPKDPKKHEILFGDSLNDILQDMAGSARKEAEAGPSPELLAGIGSGVLQQSPGVKIAQDSEQRLVLHLAMPGSLLAGLLSMAAGLFIISDALWPNWMGFAEHAIYVSRGTLGLIGALFAAVGGWVILLGKEQIVDLDRGRGSLKISSFGTRTRELPLDAIAYAQLKDSKPTGGHGSDSIMMGYLKIATEQGESIYLKGGKGSSIDARINGFLGRALAASEDAPAKPAPHNGEDGAVAES